MNGYSRLIPRTAFTDVSIETTPDRGLDIRDRDGLGFATVLARKGQQTALVRRLRERFNIELPRGPHRATAGDLALGGTGPGAWLATHEHVANGLAPLLQEAVGELASVFDQTDAYAVLRVSGRRVRQTLCRLMPIDVHERAFQPGGVASTVAGQIGVTMWRLEDRADGTPVFEIALYRSFAASFCRALASCGAELGGTTGAYGEFGR